MLADASRLSTGDWIALAALVVTIVTTLVSGVGYWMYRVVAELVGLRHDFAGLGLRLESHEEDHRELAARVDRQADRIDAHERRLDECDRRLSCFEG